MQIYSYVLLFREGVWGYGAGGCGVSEYGGLGAVLIVGVLGQEGQRRLNGRRMLLQIILFVTRQTVTHVVGRVWELIVEPPGALWEQRYKVRLRERENERFVYLMRALRHCHPDITHAGADTLKPGPFFSNSEYMNV